MENTDCQVRRDAEAPLSWAADAPQESSKVLTDLWALRAQPPTGQSWSFPDPGSRMISAALLDRIITILYALEPAKR